MMRWTPSFLKASTASAVGITNRVGHAEQTSEITINGDVHYCLSLSPQRISFLLQNRCVDGFSGHETPIAQQDPVSLHLAGDAFARYVSELLRLHFLCPTLPRAGENRGGQRMLAGGLQPGGEPPGRLAR